MVKLVDTKDLNSFSHCESAGSNPVWGTTGIPVVNIVIFTNSCCETPIEHHHSFFVIKVRLYDVAP